VSIWGLPSSIVSLSHLGQRVRTSILSKLILLGYGFKILGSVRISHGKTRFSAFCFVTRSANRLIVMLRKDEKKSIVIPAAKEFLLWIVRLTIPAYYECFNAQTCRYATLPLCMVS
jgi:hypothetical protein